MTCDLRAHYLQPMYSHFMSPRLQFTSNRSCQQCQQLSCQSAPTITVTQESYCARNHSSQALTARVLAGPQGHDHARAHHTHARHTCPCPCSPVLNAASELPSTSSADHAWSGLVNHSLAVDSTIGPQGLVYHAHVLLGTRADRCTRTGSG